MNIYFWQLLLSSPFISASDFGGDFSANGLSGASAPGATSGTMGSQAASAMSIGTGSSGAGDYASNYKTPNYTQYTQQDFKGILYYILSGQKLIKNAKNNPFWRVFKKP